MLEYLRVDPKPRVLKFSIALFTGCAFITVIVSPFLFDYTEPLILHGQINSGPLLGQRYYFVSGLLFRCGQHLLYIHSIVIFCYISDDASDSIEVQQRGIGSLKNKNDQRNGGRINITLTDNPHGSKWLHMYYSLKMVVHGLLGVIW